MTSTSPQYELQDKRFATAAAILGGTKGSRHVRGKGNVKHLECGCCTKEHLKKRDSFTPELLLSKPARQPQRQKKGGSDGVRGAEIKHWAGRGRELQQEDRVDDN